MSGSAFPPHHSTDSLPISQATALTYLQTYLSRAQSSPFLLPNARLEPSGPTAGSSNSSITIHNLQRVEAGLRGEWLAPKLDLTDAVEVVEGMDDGTNTGIGAEGMKGAEEGWMDLDQYQREQSIEGGEVGTPRLDIIEEGEDDSDFEGEVGGHGQQHEDMLVDGKSEEKIEGSARRKLNSTHQIAPKNVAAEKPKDKAARKSAKKQRVKAEQKARETAKQAALRAEN